MHVMRLANGRYITFHTNKLSLFAYGFDAIVTFFVNFAVGTNINVLLNVAEQLRHSQITQQIVLIIVNFFQMT